MQFSPWQVGKDPLHSDFHCHHWSGHFWYCSLVRLQLPHDVAGLSAGIEMLTCSVFAAWSWMIWLFQPIMFDGQCVISVRFSRILEDIGDDGRSSIASPTRRRPPFMLSSMWAPLCLATQSTQFFFSSAQNLNMVIFVKVWLVASCWISSSVDFLIMVHLPYLRPEKNKKKTMGDPAAAFFCLFLQTF